MEFAHQGAHCQYDSCRQQDFLPFNCARCQKSFCLLHRTHEEHECQSLAVDEGRTLAKPPKTMLPDKYKCERVDCKNTELQPIVCRYCERNHCLAHRFPTLHMCSAYTEGRNRKPIESSMKSNPVVSSSASTQSSRTQPGVSSASASSMGASASPSNVSSVTSSSSSTSSSSTSSACSSSRFAAQHFNSADVSVSSDDEESDESDEDVEDDKKDDCCVPAWHIDEARGQRNLDTILRSQTERVLREGPLEVAYQLCLTNNVHLIGRVHLNPDGQMDYEGFAPWDVLAFMLNQTAEKYLPHQKEKKKLRRSQVVTKCIILSDFDWFRVMQAQLVSTKTANRPNGRSTTNFLRLRHSQASIMTFAIEDTLQGQQTLCLEFQRMRENGLFMVGFIYWSTRGSVNYEGFVPVEALLVACNWTVRNLRPTQSELQGLRETQKPGISFLCILEQEWQELGLPKCKVPETYFKAMKVNTFDPQSQGDDGDGDDDSSVDLSDRPINAQALTLACNHCGRQNASRCSGCFGVAYCSDACKKHDWFKHSELCLRRKAIRLQRLHESIPTFTASLESTRDGLSSVSSSNTTHTVTATAAAPSPSTSPACSSTSRGCPSGTAASSVTGPSSLAGTAFQVPPPPGLSSDDRTYCTVCASATTHKCSQCKQVYYCSSACQSKQWSTHQLMCVPPLMHAWFQSQKRDLSDLQQLKKDRLISSVHVIVLTSEGKMELVLPTHSSILRVTSNDMAVADRILKRIRQKQRAQANLFIFSARQFACVEFVIPL